MEPAAQPDVSEKLKKEMAIVGESEREREMERENEMEFLVGNFCH